MVETIGSRLPAPGPADPRRAVARTLSREDPKASLAEIAGTLGVWYSTASTIVSHAMGLPLRAYRYGRMCDPAANRLLSRASPTELAAEAGFTDSAHLTRSWQRSYGHPPSSTRDARHVRVVVRPHRSSAGSGARAQGRVASMGGRSDRHAHDLASSAGRPGRCALPPAGGLQPSVELRDHRRGHRRSDPGHLRRPIRLAPDRHRKAGVGVHGLAVPGRGPLPRHPIGFGGRLVDRGHPASLQNTRRHEADAVVLNVLRALRGPCPLGASRPRRRCLPPRRYPRSAA